MGREEGGKSVFVGERGVFIKKEAFESKLDENELCIMMNIHQNFKIKVSRIDTK